MRNKPKFNTATLQGCKDALMWWKANNNTEASRRGIVRLEKRIEMFESFDSKTVQVADKLFTRV